MLLHVYDQPMYDRGTTDLCDKDPGEKIVIMHDVSTSGSRAPAGGLFCSKRSASRDSRSHIYHSVPIRSGVQIEIPGISSEQNGKKVGVTVVGVGS